MIDKTEDKNGGIYIPITLQCGLCKITLTISAPLGHAIYELTGDLMMPRLSRLDLQGWKVEYREKVFERDEIGRRKKFTWWTEVTCPSCIPDRDNLKALEKP